MTILVDHFMRAKQLALLIIAASMLVTGLDSALAAAPAKPLVELESHIQWSAVSSAWKDLRAGWVTKTSGCDEAACVGIQLLKLEENVEWKAVNPKWAARRPDWVKECQNVTTDTQAAKLLLELEQNIGWSAVDKDWKGAREGWMARVKGS